MADLIFGNSAVFMHEATEVGQIISLSHSRSRVEIQATTLDSTDHEYRPGLHDPGSISMTIQFNTGSTAHNALLATMGSGALQDFSIAVNNDNATPVTKTYSMSGFLTSWEMNGMEQDALVQVDLEIKLSGAITVA